MTSARLLLILDWYLAYAKKGGEGSLKKVESARILDSVMSARGDDAGRHLGHGSLE
jgi:hypothetical protein